MRRTLRTEIHPQKEGSAFRYSVRML